MGTINGLITAVLLVLFIAIWVWAWSGRNKEKFDRMSRLPLEEESRENSEGKNNV
jgi:cytochrome c oxidase cbb3-type subunit 4